MAWPDSKKQHQATGKIHTVDFGPNAVNFAIAEMIGELLTL